MRGILEGPVVWARRRVGALTFVFAPSWVLAAALMPLAQSGESFGSVRDSSTYGGNSFETTRRQAMQAICRKRAKTRSRGPEGAYRSLSISCLYFSRGERR